MCRNRPMLYTVAFTLIALGTSAVLASARAQALTAVQWRADLQQLSNSIRTVHPSPFHKIDEARFAGAVDSLRRDIPGLDGKEIVVRMAEITALLKDGHTRLALPRMHPQIGLEFGHSRTERPHLSELIFRQLPLAFEQFEDGLYVVAASQAYAKYIGHEVVSIGRMSAADAMETAQRITYAENKQLQKLMGADRLTLPEALRALNIIEDPLSTRIELRSRDGTAVRLVLAPLQNGEIDWARAPLTNNIPVRRQEKNRKLWSTYLKAENVVYARIDEIADADVTLASFSMSVIREAERRNARLVIDLRHNFGGNNSLNRTLVLGLVQSAELNDYGRAFVIIGRRSFSAAQHLINQLELYTHVLFVGEPSGSRPDHFGDARKIRLENSGLTLRVSTLHWSSMIGNDRRHATNPDLPAPWTSQAFFSGEDPALATLIGFRPPQNIGDLVGPALRRGDHYQVYRYLSLARLSPNTHDYDFSHDLLRLGRKFEKEQNTELASFAYRYGLNFFPEDSELSSALDGLGTEKR